MEGLIVTRWTKPRSGKETEAWALGEEVDAFAKRLKGQGTITGFEWIGGFTGSDGHMSIIRGDPSKLMALSVTPEMMEIWTKGALVHEDFRFDFAVSGSTLGDAWPVWAAMLGK